MGKQKRRPKGRRLVVFDREVLEIAVVGRDLAFDFLFKFWIRLYRAVQQSRLNSVYRGRYVDGVSLILFWFALLFQELERISQFPANLKRLSDRVTRNVDMH